MTKFIKALLIFAALNGGGCFIGLEVYKQAYKATQRDLDEATRSKDTYQVNILSTRLLNYLDVICEEEPTFSTECLLNKGINAPLTTVKGVKVK